MLSLIDWLRLQDSSIRDSDHALLLERVFCEQYEMGMDAPERRKVEASGVIKNPHDPDVQWATKDQSKIKQWEGYKVQIAETVDEDGKRIAIDPAKKISNILSKEGVLKKFHDSKFSK